MKKAKTDDIPSKEDIEEALKHHREVIAFYKGRKLSEPQFIIYNYSRKMLPRWEEAESRLLNGYISHDC